jgi:three-Cys-motif partner protein
MIDALPNSYRGRGQTFIKHEILKRYLERVAWNILWFRPEFVFVDGFSGPWHSNTNNYEDTSFVIAMRILRKVRKDLKTDRGLNRHIRCIFVERGARAFARLQEAVQANPDIEATAIHGRFEDKIDDIIASVGKDFALISVDPKGWSFDLRKLSPLLRRRPSEVVVNFMYDFINRFLDDERAEIRASYALPFGDPDWRTRFDELQASGLSREDAVLELFRYQLKTIGEYDYVLSARVQRPTSDRSHFYLVYGTRNQKGLIEFRNVERKAMETEELVRIEEKHSKRASKSRQGMLSVYSPRSISDLRKPQIDGAQRWLAQRFSSVRALSYAVVLTGVLERFAVTETELKDRLVLMEHAGQVAFRGMRPRQRKPDSGVTILATPSS